MNCRFFSLTQVNYRPQSAEDAWTVWGAPDPAILEIKRPVRPTPD